MNGRVVPRTLPSPVRLVLLLVLSLGLVLGGAPAAEAHALLESSSPGDGATLDSPPQELLLRFSEDVTVATVRVSVVGDDGRPVAAGMPHGDAGRDAEQASAVTVALPVLPVGRYLVRWSAISSDDLHPTDGTLVFGVGTAVTAGAAGDGVLPTGDGAAEALLRWLALLAFGLGVGGVVLRRRLAARGLAARGLAADSTEAAEPVLSRTVPVAVGTGVLAVGALAALYVARVAVVGGVAPALLTPAVSGRWAAAVAAGIVAYVLVRRRTPTSLSDGAALVALVTALGATTATGHAATGGVLSALLGAVHTVATVTWAGGVAAVVVIAVAARRRAAASVSGREAARAFTPVALLTVVVGTVTGLLLSGRLLASVGAVTSTAYGHVLIAKLAVAALALVCAGGTVLLLTRGAASPVRRAAVVVVVLEAVLLAAVVLVASTLAATHPASPTVWAAAPDPAPTSGVESQFADDLVLTLSVGPGEPGPNFASVGVLDTRRPAPASVTGVTVTIEGAPSVSAAAQGKGRWLARMDLSAGPELVTVQVTRPGLPETRAAFTWVVGPVAGTHRGGAALAPLTDRLAVILLVVALLALVAVATTAVRRRRRTVPRGAEVAGGGTTFDSVGTVEVDPAAASDVSDRSQAAAPPDVLSRT